MQRVDPLGLFEDFSAFTNAPGIQYELTKAMFADLWYTPNPSAFSGSPRGEIIGKIDSVVPSISDVDFMGLEAVVKQAGLQDYIADIKFNVSGSLDVVLTCKATDHSGYSEEWKRGVTVSVKNMPVKVPYKEPSIPIPGMKEVILFDKILNTGQFISQWHEELLAYGGKHH